MFIKFAVLVGVAAAAAPFVSQCEPGKTAMCCNTVQSGANHDFSGLSSVLPSSDLAGIDLQNPGLIGQGCAPIPSIAIAQGAECAQQPVCCRAVLGGLVNLDCTPFSI